MLLDQEEDEHADGDDGKAQERDPGGFARHAGGELTIQLGAQELSYKLDAGSAILYPSTTIHRVSPVTRGVRLAAITWLQSWVADSNRRELLVQLDEARALVASGGDRQRLQVLLESLRTNLFRMWADT